MKKYRVIQKTFSDSSKIYIPQFKRFGFWCDFKYMHQGGGTASYSFKTEDEARSMIISESKSPSILVNVKDLG